MEGFVVDAITIKLPGDHKTANYAILDFLDLKVAYVVEPLRGGQVDGKPYDQHPKLPVLLYI